MIIMLLNFIQVQPTYNTEHHCIVDIPAGTYQVVRVIIENCDTFLTAQNLELSTLYGLLS
jgi:hypothetical protein